MEEVPADGGGGGGGGCESQIVAGDGDGGVWSNLPSIIFLNPIDKEEIKSFVL